MTADEVAAAVLDALREKRGGPLNDPSLIDGEPAIGVEDDDGELWFIAVQPA